MRWLVALVFAASLAGAACGPRVRPGPQHKDGDVLASEPCRAPRYGRFVRVVEWSVEEDLERAGLLDELERTPVRRIYPHAEIARFTETVLANRCTHLWYASDGLRVGGYVMKPATPGPHPAILYARGGNGDFGNVGMVTLVELHAFVEQGYVVIATQYRGGGDGSQGEDEFGGKDVADLINLVPLARSMPEVDASALYLLGHSRGGMQAALAIRRKIPVRAAVLRSGAYDLALGAEDRPEMEEVYERIPGYEEDREAALRSRSAVEWAGELDVPLLLLHGRQDWRVPVEVAERFAERLDEAKKESKLVVYDRDEHQLLFHRKEALAESLAWFRAHAP